MWIHIKTKKCDNKIRQISKNNPSDSKKRQSELKNPKQNIKNIFKPLKILKKKIL